MRGTEKQAKWAESIRAGWTEKCEQTLASLVLPLAQPEAAGEVADIIANIKTIDDASWWIDNRRLLEVNSGNYADLHKKEAMILVAKAAEYFGKRKGRD
jgi:hypothetical protein